MPHTHIQIRERKHIDRQHYLIFTDSPRPDPARLLMMRRNEGWMIWIRWQEHMMTGRQQSTIRMLWTAHARFAIPYQHRNGNSPRRRHRTAIWMLWIVNTFLGLRPFRLVPMILKPDLHLCRCQMYLAGQVFAFGRRQISLLAKSALQLECLMLRKENAPFALFATATATQTARLLLAAIILQIQFIVGTVHTVNIVHGLAIISIIVLRMSFVHC